MSPILIGGAVIGAVVLLAMRSKGQTVYQGNPLTVIPTADADQSSISNLIQAINNTAKGGPQLPGSNPNPVSPVAPTVPINPPSGPNPISIVIPGLTPTNPANVQSGAMAPAASSYEARVAQYLANPWSAVTPSNNPRDVSPEHTLPGNIYAGTVFGSVLSPSQAAQVRYSGPQFEGFLDTLTTEQKYGTAQNLANALAANAHVGKASDVRAGLQQTIDNQYNDWISRLGKTQAQAQAEGLTLDKFKSVMAPQVTGQLS